MSKHPNKNNSKNSTQSQGMKPIQQDKNEITKEQIDRIDAIEAQNEVLIAEYGVPNTVGIPLPPGTNVEKNLKRIEELYLQAIVLSEKIREDKCEVDTNKKEYAKQLDKFERREKKLQADEKEFADQLVKLTEREINAEQGFKLEKDRVLKPLDNEVVRLREERDNLNLEISDLRSKAEEEVRKGAKEWSEKWAKESEERMRLMAENRRAFDEEMAKERRESYAKLRLELKAERENLEAQTLKEIEERKLFLVDRENEINEREQILNTSNRGLHRAQQDILVEQDMLAENKAALIRKVERLVSERVEDLRHEVETLNKQLEDARIQRDRYFSELESRRELDRRFGGRPPEQIIGDFNALEHERDNLAQQLRERPDSRVAERLAELERDRSVWLEEKALLQGDLAKAAGELSTRRLSAIELETIKKQKEALEIHKQLLDGAVDELRSRVDELTRQENHLNPMTALSSLDENEELRVECRTTTPLGKSTPTLRDFAEDLRHRIAKGVEGRTLYYSDRDIRAFLGGLAMTRMMLLQGISGTGKTSLPLAFADAVGGGIEVVEVQAGWRDRQDLVGYYNAFHRHYYATNFLQALYKAGTPAYRDRLFLMVLDEINLSRPEQFFADFLSALEQPINNRRLTLVNDPVNNAPLLMIDGLHLPIPPNVWFVGTANHDESTAEFADKTYDRAHVMEMPRKTDSVHFNVQNKSSRHSISYERLEEAFAAAEVNHKDKVSKATSWLRDAPFAKDLEQRFRIGWGNRLEHQLARYLPVVVEAGGSVGEAMDHLLVTKVLRKLKDRHDVRVSALEELNAKIFTSWDKLDPDNLPLRCMDLIEKEIAAKKGEELM